MKLTAILLTIACLHVAAKGHTQTVTLSLKDAPLQMAFSEIKKQSGYSFLYNDKTLATAQRVNIEVTNMSLSKVLIMVFKNQPLNYSIVDNVIVVKGKEPEQEILRLSEDDIPPPIDVHGRVVNEKGEPVEGVSVVIKETKTGTSTDANGYFELKDVKENAVLVISATNIETREINVSGNTSLNTIIVKIKISSLDEMQVIAYGSTTKRSSTGSVSKISSSLIEKAPISNPLQALEGRASGLFITEGGGAAGSSINVMIRGQNSIAAGIMPLFVIDGVPFDARPLEQSMGITSSGLNPNGTGFSPFNTIPPSDIESVSILKDADATALYGARGANGVVLITTKKGKAGKTKLDVGVYSGWGEVTRTLPMLSTKQYLDLRNQGFTNDGVTPNNTNAPDLKIWDTTKSTDFQKLLIGGTSKVTDATVSVSGGDVLTQFLFSGNYHRTTSVFPGDFADTRIQFRSNVSHHSANKRFVMNTTVSYSKDKNELPNFNLASSFSLAPNYPLYNPDGSLYWYNTAFTNPLSIFKTIFTGTTDNFIGNGSFSYKIIPELTAKLDIGYGKVSIDRVNATTKASRNPFSSSASTGAVTLANDFIETYLAEPQLNYIKNISKGRLEALAGGTLQYQKFAEPYSISGTYTNDGLYHDLSSITINSKRSIYSDYKFASFFTRLNYNWQGKYIVNLNFRRDGSSRFGNNNRYGNFGSAGASWVFSKETFMKNAGWLSFGKLRSSYGTVGNDQIRDYLYLSAYSGTSGPYGNSPGLIPNRIANPDLAWEVTKKLEIATELGFMQDRLLFNAAWYRNRTNNILALAPIPTQAGFSNFTSNVPALIQNTGWEFDITSYNVKNKNFTWTTTANLTIPKNKLISFPNLKTSVYANTYLEGQSLSIMNVYHYTGSKNGLPEVQDLNNDGLYTPRLAYNGGDYINGGNRGPQYYAGINNSIKYKNFQLDFFFQGVKQKGFGILQPFFTSLPAPGNTTNLPAFVTELPINATVSKAGTAAATAWNNYIRSDAAISDASYIRVKNVSLSYNIPEKALNRLKIKNCRIYMSGQNLFTITKYQGFDPETQGTNLPPMKLITAGFQCSF